MVSQKPEPTLPGPIEDIIEALKFELQFLTDGGYGRSVRTPWKATRAFQDSPTCLNFNDPERPHPCAECFLTEFVPPERRTEDVPCHHIRLNETGDTIHRLGTVGKQDEAEEALKKWLVLTIKRLEEQRAKTNQ